MAKEKFKWYSYHVTRTKLEQVVSAQFPCMHYETVITNRHECYFLFCRASILSVEWKVIQYSVCLFLIQQTFPTLLWCETFKYRNTNIFEGFPSNTVLNTARDIRVLSQSPAWIGAANTSVTWVSWQMLKAEVATYSVAISLLWCRRAWWHNPLS